MEITDIRNRQVKIGKTSITVKNSIGKTAGIVRNVIKFNDLQPNKQIDYWKILRSTGIIEARKTDCVVIVDQKLYFLNNTKGDHMKKVAFPEEWKEKNNLIESVSQYMTVIPCEFV